MYRRNCVLVVLDWSNEKFAPALTPPLFDKDSEDEESRASPVPPNKSQSFTGKEQVVQAVAEVEEEQPPLISASIQDSSIASISGPDAYIEINDLLDPNPPSSTSDNESFTYEDFDDYRY
ncbi:uncharacterized protein LOC110020863 [Phalaenopsis equestris]|uniref:uncharacterized protein LOC110020863 n=1 Tax=Phalaenopsis equestris TaxID=78828 RepID=UPI0009E4B4B9|nr:uncharacterized protein LOC110020863 [Phalaenopsis equestris]